MAALGAQLMTVICGSALTMVMFSIAIFIQSFPEIVKAIQGVVSGLIIFSSSVYSLLLGMVGLNISKNVGGRTVASIVISLLFCAIVSYLLTEHLQIIPMVIASLHGLAVGVYWNDNDVDGLHLGDDL